jgi:hypothetical protein
MAITHADLSQPASPTSALAKLRDAAGYWFGLPVRWALQMVRNGSDILRVLDIMRFRPLPAGLVDLQHPWVTGINPQTGKPIWHDNVIYRSPRNPESSTLAQDDVVLMANGRFLAHRVRQSAITPEVPIGPQRRMPHAINYMHGSSHYNSGIILLNDLQDGYRHITDPRFRRELIRFVRTERREVLFLFRERRYDPREYAYFSCCMRSLFPWFCNPNGPEERVLWGNAAPFPAANLITGHWADDVYALNRPDGAQQVVRPPVQAHNRLSTGPFDAGRRFALWPEKALAWLTYLRVKIRGAKGGMFFIDRRKIYEDQIRNRESRGIVDEPQARFVRD